MRVWLISEALWVSRKLIFSGYPLGGRNGRSASIPGSSIRSEWKLDPTRFPDTKCQNHSKSLTLGRLASSGAGNAASTWRGEEG